MVAITTGINSTKSIFDPEVLAKLSDHDLHKYAQQYGKISRQAQKQFAAFLPEIFKRKLYLKYKFYSIKHYAKVIGGLSEDVVDEILRVHINLKGKPKLERMIVEQGWSKMTVIASVATAETQDFWAEKVKEMSKPTLEIFVRELKKQGDLLGTQNTTENVQQSIDFLRGEEKIAGQKQELSQEQAENYAGDAKRRTSISFKIDLESEIQLRIFRQ